MSAFIENKTMIQENTQAGPSSQQTEQNPETTEIRTVTQITPDDIIADQGPVEPEPKENPVPEEKVEEDVVTINPSVESMENRG